jgi:peptide/nickel transport system substrate-binding protein
VSFKPDAEINWTRFDDYWGGKPLLDGVQTVFMTDEMAKSAALQSGAVDILFNVTPEVGVTL